MVTMPKQKNRRSRTAALIASTTLAAATLVVGVVVNAAPSDVVQPPDSALRGCVTAAFGLGAPFTQAQLAAISNLTREGVAKLEGVQYMTGAATLNFDRGSIVDLRPLASLAPLNPRDAASTTNTATHAARSATKDAFMTSIAGVRGVGNSCG